MAYLEDILAAILRALIAAQDEANLYTRDISEKYWKDRLLRSFPVPNALLTQVDLEFRFAVEGVATGDDPHFVLAPSRAALALPARQIATWAIELLRELVRSNPTPRDPDKAKTIVATLGEQRIADSVAQDVAYALYEARAALVDPQGHLDRTAAENAIIAGLSRNLLSDADLAAQCRVSPKDAIIERLRDDTGTNPPIEPLEALLAGPEPVRHPSNLKVVVNADKLDSEPEKNLHKLFIKCELRNYKWVIHESGDEILVPED